jgi:hypothetical protein
MKEFQYIKEIEYVYRADIGLSYSSPCRGAWNIVHYGTLVPEGHQIYVCPVSCLRGVVLTTAEMGPEAMEKLSTIAVGEDNILNGDLEEQVLHGVEHIINTLPKRPRMVMIFTSCIHHFLAVNYQRVYKILRQEYPDIDFIDCYMNPIMKRKTPPMPSLRRQILRVLNPAEPDNKQVSFVGNCFPMGEHCDLANFLRRNKIRISDLTTMENYDEFKVMEHSCINFTFHNAAAWAGKDLELRLKQRWLVMRESYDYDTIDADMRAAAEALGLEPLSGDEICAEREKTEAAVAELKAVLGDTPVSIDDSAVDRPLELALYLLRHGFSVESVVMDVISEPEDVFYALQKVRPELKIYSAHSWNMRWARTKFEGKIIGIGQKSAYLSDTPYFVNITENAGMYGYAGIRRLMELIKEAAAAPKDMRALIQMKGWNCGRKECC